jgi:hypothetical protein
MALQHGKDATQYTGNLEKDKKQHQKLSIDEAISNNIDGHYNTL